MKTTRFGIEIEFTGITRRKAAETAAAFFGGTVTHGVGYDRYTTKDASGRTWSFMRDGSIVPLRKEHGRKVGACDDYKVELVTPILTYGQDMDTLQELIRKLRKAGAFTDPQNCGIHIHLDGAPHTARSIRNWVNIIASRNDLLYKALQIEPTRKRWCRELDADLVRRMNSRKPKTLAQIEEIWYEGYSESRGNHYHASRYAFLNLHSFFHGNGTVRASRIQRDAPRRQGSRLRRPCPRDEPAGTDAEQGKREKAAGGQRKIRHAHLPDAHRTERRRVCQLPGAPLQTP